MQVLLLVVLKRSNKFPVVAIHMRLCVGMTSYITIIASCFGTLLFSISSATVVVSSYFDDTLGFVSLADYV